MLIRLKSIEIEGFRAFRNKVVLEFDENLTLIQGYSGAGKTSLVRAIEFALFGETREISSRIFRRDDLINDFASIARVLLSLIDGQQEIVIERTLHRNGKSRLRVIVGSNELLDEVASQFLQEKLNVTLEDFAREIAIGYGELYLLTHSTSAVQGLLMDRLLGIDELKRLYNELNLKEIKSRYENILSDLYKLGGERNLEEYEKLKGMYKDIIAQRDKILRDIEKLETTKKILEQEKASYQFNTADLRALLEEIGSLKMILNNLRKNKTLKNISIDENFVIEYSSKLRKQLMYVSEACFLSGLKEIENVKSFDLNLNKIEDFISLIKNILFKIRECINNLEYEIRDIINEEKRLEKEIYWIENKLSEIEYNIEEYNQYKSEYDKILNKYGDLTTIVKKISQLEVDLKAISIDEKRSECVHVLQKNIIENLKSGNTVTCPVCGEVISNSELLPKKEPLESLLVKREKIEQTLKELKEVELRLRKLESDMRALSDYEESRSELESILDEKLNELEELRSSREELEARLNVVRRHYAELSKGCELLEEYYTRYIYQITKKRLENLEEQLRELGYDENRLKQINDELIRIEKEISEKRGRLKELERREKELAIELEQLEALIKKVSILKEKGEHLMVLYDRLRKAREALLNVRSKLRQSLVRQLSEIASQIFVKLSPSGIYDSIVVDVESLGSRGKRGRYTFLVKRSIDGSLVSASTRLSDGQKSLLAFALMLALRSLKPRQPPILILDDPLLNVDEATRLSILKSLPVLCKGHQIIITTQSESLAKNLEKEVKVYYLDRLAL